MQGQTVYGSSEFTDESPNVVREEECFYNVSERCLLDACNDQ